ncbi:C40 family peptidase [Streptomyces sp. P38-E01]|uniref:C40 family peptidase n=1 Tax=Streptomyces tardus TaxID=2780544 RepID=A0A949NA38_9ACTN|nr:NlpC/P60 family protein [Streptomyces tardus]MBU7599508.1 C40 family peptidase [Streptomyces tardus]
MASHRRPKQPSRTRVTVLTATAAAAVAVTAQSAQADPNASKSEVKAKVDKLYEEASAATEKYNGAKEKADKLEKQTERLRDSVARGQAELNKLRNGLGAMATAQYRSGSVDPSMQLFLSADPDSYLSRAATLDQMSGKQAGELKQIQDKQRSLAQQRKEAKTKLDQLESTRKELGSKKKDIQGKLSKARSLLNELTAEERQQIAADEERASRAAGDRADLGGGSEAPAPGRASSAYGAAQSKVGLPYVWGATGPSSFDCSGLTSWAFQQAGVSIPRTSEAQANIGTRISRSQLAPGDLVFFYNDLHHVGFYAGNGQILHAPKPGANVRYESINNMPFMFGVRV